MKKGDRLFLKCRDTITGTLLKFPVVVSGLSTCRAYVVGDSFAYWIGLRNSYRDDIWLARR